jgi:molecular chaperone DnaJ
LLKDYYKILELPQQATLGEIKKSFRKLALRYHPDTNQGDKYAEAWYHEIQEAYQTLSDEHLRNEYLQQRWLLKSQGLSFAPIMALTPSFILRQSEELYEQVRSMDHFRMSHPLLQEQALNVLKNENIDVLIKFNDEPINRQFTQLIINSLEPLDYKFLQPVFLQLAKLTSKNKANKQLQQQYEAKRKSEYVWNKYQGLFYMLLTALLCVVIYMLGK